MMVSAGFLNVNNVSQQTHFPGDKHGSDMSWFQLSLLSCPNKCLIQLLSEPLRGLNYDLFQLHKKKYNSH